MAASLYVLGFGLIWNTVAVGTADQLAAWRARTAAGGERERYRKGRVLAVLPPGSTPPTPPREGEPLLYDLEPIKAWLESHLLTGTCYWDGSDAEQLGVKGLGRRQRAPRIGTLAARVRSRKPTA